MKKVGLLLMALLCSFVSSYGQASAVASIGTVTLNQTVNPTYTFQINVQRGGTWNLGTGTFGFTFTSGAFTSAALTDATFNSAISGYTGSVTALSATGITVNLANAGGALSLSTTPPGTTIGTVTLKVADLSKSANLLFTSAAITRTNGQAISTTFSGTDNTPLPVTLTSFNVYRQDANSAQLSWSTAMEENNKGFYIERSADGKKWQTISFIASKSENGNSHALTQYNFIDLNVYKPASRINTFYYRLRQQDFNGKEEYVGGVKSIRFSGAANTVSFGPNPASEYVMVNTDEADLQVIIFDMTGRIMQAEANAKRVDVSTLKPGPYMLLLKNASGEIISTDKLMINR